MVGKHPGGACEQEATESRTRSESDGDVDQWLATVPGLSALPAVLVGGGALGGFGAQRGGGGSGRGCWPTGWRWPRPFHRPPRVEPCRRSIRSRIESGPPSRTSSSVW